MRLSVLGLVRLSIEDVGVAKVRAELLFDHRPAHQLVDGEEFE